MGRAANNCTTFWKFKLEMSTFLLDYNSIIQMEMLQMVPPKKEKLIGFEPGAVPQAQIRSSFSQVPFLILCVCDARSSDICAKSHEIAGSVIGCATRIA